MSYTTTPQKQYNEYHKPEFSKFLQALEKEILSEYDGVFQCRLKDSNYDSASWPNEVSLSAPFDYSTYHFKLSRAQGTPIESSEPMFLDSYANRLHVVALNIKGNEDDLKIFRYLSMIPNCDWSFWSMSKDDDLAASEFCMEAISGHRMHNEKYSTSIYRVKSDPYLEKRLQTQAERARLINLAFQMNAHELQQITNLQSKGRDEMLDSLVNEINHGRVTSLSFSNSSVDTTALDSRARKVSESTKKKSRNRSENELPVGE